MDSGFRPEPNDKFLDPWRNEPHGEAYANEASNSYADQPALEEPWAPEPMYDSDAYQAAQQTPTLISPWLIHDLRATPMMIGGQPGVEITMSITRDYDRASQVCPHEGYDILGWHHEISLAMRANRHGRWATFVPSVGAYQPQAVGDGATVELGRQLLAAAWRFTPDMLGQFDIWAFVLINGVCVPFDEMMSSAHYIDTNGAAKLSVLL